MAKTEFQNGTVVTTAFLQSIYGTNADGGHKHDGADADGHCAKITMEELAQNVFEYVQSVVSDRFIGDIRAYAGSLSTVPEGYLLCDGSYVLGPDYQAYRGWVDANRPDLVENGVYKTPDLRGRVLVGAGTGKDKNNKEITFVLGSTDGEFEHTLTLEEMPRHRHKVDKKYGIPNTSGRNSLSSNGDNNDLSDLHVDYQGGDENGNTIPHNNIQPYAVVNYIIRVL